MTESSTDVPVPLKHKTGAAARLGTGRPRGRPKKTVVTQSKLASQEHELSGFEFSILIPVVAEVWVQQYCDQWHYIA